MLHPTGEIRLKPGRTVQGIDSEAEADVFEVNGRAARVEVGFVRWPNGEEDVQQLSWLAGPEAVAGLTGRLRMSIYQVGDRDWCEVEQAWVDPSGRPKRGMVDLEALDAGAELSSAKLLRQLGGEIGTRSQLLQDQGPRRNRLCVVFSPDTPIVPIAAFVISRLAPVIAASGPPVAVESDAAIEIRRLIARGESQRVEFKASARWDMESKGLNKAVEDAVVKTVIGFANSSEGGVLLVGVNDERAVVGLAGDFKLMGRRQDADGFENWLMTLLATRMGKVAAADIRVSMVLVDAQYVCRVDVEPSIRPVFDSGKHFFVRMANGTRELDGAEILQYCEHRFR